MNKRQRKKLDKKLIIAIRELNNDVAKSDGYLIATDEEIYKVLPAVKTSKESINRTLKDYRRFILNG